MKNSGNYEAVIGLEVHVQLLTKSKAFCGDSTLFGSPPNTQTSTISLAHPGTLPRPNQAQIDCAIKLGIALGCEINRKSLFDRKHYFYADLPKGFQTTQNDQPICLGGVVTFPVDGVAKTIRLHHIHMEEDAGKSLHEDAQEHSFIDLNRAGIPLLEIVTEPDFRSADEVYHFINELRRIVRYLEISDGNMQEGSLRCDCNISVRIAGDEILNPRTEVKNINSAKFAKKAIEFEISRQSVLMAEGKAVTQETREFLPQKGITTPLRDKEDAHDYRYFPEPDILPLQIDDKYIERIKGSVPLLPYQYRIRFLEDYKIASSDVEVIVESRSRAEAFQQFVSSNPEIPPQQAANFYINKWYPAEDGSQLPGDLSTEHIAQLLKMINDKTISSSAAYQKLWPVLLEQPQDVMTLCKDLNLLQTTDKDFIIDLAEKVIRDHPEQLERYRKGKKGLVTFFIGQLMRRSKGKANPEMAREALENILNE